MNGLFVAASGAASQMEALEISVHNLANASTPGFRRFELVIQAQSDNSSPYQYATALGAEPPIDLAQGPVRNSGNPLDVAVVGPGFIRVETPGGEAYTRNGQLEISPEGTLLAAGQPVIREGGGTFTLGPGDVMIAADGSLTVGGLANGRIALADPAGVAMKSAGGSLYRTADGSDLPAAESGSELRQGFLEESVGDPVTGVVGMLGIMRSYESAMRAVQTIDQSQERTIQALTIQA